MMMTSYESIVMLLHLLGDDDSRRRFDQRKVGERLREVAQVVSCFGVELLGVQPQRRIDPKQSIHQVACALDLLDDR